MNKNKSNDRKSDDYIYHSSTTEIPKPDLHDFDSNNNTDKLPATSALKPLPVRGILFASPKKKIFEEETTETESKVPHKRIAKLKCKIPEEILLTHRDKHIEST